MARQYAESTVPVANRKLAAGLARSTGNA